MTSFSLSKHPFFTFLLRVVNKTVIAILKANTPKAVRKEEEEKMKMNKYKKNKKNKFNI